MLACEQCGEEFERPSTKGPTPKYCCAAHRQAAFRSRHGRVQWECEVDDVGLVVALAILTEGRCDEEQEALLNLARAVDRRRGNTALETLARASWDGSLDKVVCTWAENDDPRPWARPEPPDLPDWATP